MVAGSMLIARPNEQLHNQRLSKILDIAAAPVDHVIWDGNNISTVHGNDGDVVSYNVTSESGLEWPKGSGRFAVFASGIWLASGKSRTPGGDWEQDMRTACAEYTQEFTPGAIGSNNDDSGHIFEIHKKEIQAFVENDYAVFSSMVLDLPISVIDGTNIETELVAKSLPTSDFENWPADEGAPFVDANGDGVYNILDGDYPDILGDLFHWYVMNDANAAKHTPLFGTPPMNVEVQTSLFGFDQAGPLGDILFVRWVIVNKGTDDLDSVFVSFWHDDDVGDAGDDLVGCDTDLSLGYTYNAPGGDQTYGVEVPAVGTDFFQGPLVEAPGDTAQILTWSVENGYYLRRVPDQTQLPLTSFVKYINADPRLVDPNTAEAAYRYMNGRVGLTNEQFVDPTTGRASNFIHPGNPSTNTGWVDHTPGDRRYLMSSGPFTMAVGDTQEVVGSVILAASTAWDKSVNKLKFFDLHAQQAFDANFKVCSPVSPEVDVAMEDKKLILSWEENSDRVENYTCAGYIFEGYNIYQGESVNGPWTKIQTYDVIDGYQILSSGVQDEITGGVIVMPVQEGRDTGIRHHIEIDYDYVNSRELVNNRQYYYAVTSYLYDPDPMSTFAFLESPFKAVDVVPGGLSVGTEYSFEFGDTIVVEHTDGFATGVDFFPTVIDPYQLTGHTYELTFDFINDSTNYWTLVDLNEGDTLAYQKNFPVTAEYYTEKTNGGAVVPDYIGEPTADHAWITITDGFLLTTEKATYFQPENHSGYSIIADNDPLTPMIFQSVMSAALPPSSDIGDGSWNAYLSTLPLAQASGSPDPPDMKKDIQFRFTDNGSIATFVDNYALVGQPTDTVWVPFEMWTVEPEDTQRVNIAVYQVAATRPFFERDSTTGGWLVTKNVAFMPVYEPYDEAGILASPLRPDSADGQKMGWMLQVNKEESIFESGDIFQVHFSNQLIPGEDVYRFTAHTLAAVSDKKTIKDQIDRINVYPNPYFGQNPEEVTPLERFVYFTNLGVGTSTIRIFTLAGDIVAKVEKTIESENDANRRAAWDMRNRFGIPVASGMYIAHVTVEDSNGKQLGQKVLKLAIFQPEERLDVY